MSIKTSSGRKILFISVFAMPKATLAPLFLLIIVFLKTAFPQELVSPCPRLFQYEQKSGENDRWYGTVTVTSDIELNGVWFRVLLDKQSIQLGNWFGEVATRDNNTGFLIKNPGYKVVPNVPLQIRFYVRYNPNEPIPRLLEMRLNARKICPEGGSTTPAPGPSGQLFTNKPEIGDPLSVPSASAGIPNGGNNFGGGSFQRPTPNFEQGNSQFNTDDDFYHGDYSLILKPQASQANIFSATCGTVVVSGKNSTANAALAYKKPKTQTDRVKRHGAVSRQIYRVYSRGRAGTEYRVYLEMIPLVFETVLHSNLNEVEKHPRPLITHGQATNEGEFPWHAALYHSRGIDLTYICGASLISLQHLLTVAHCVTRRKSQTALNPSNLVVYLGKFYLKIFTNPGLQDRNVENIIVHPKYNPQSFGNDIAVLKLNNPVELTNYVRPVCLWEGGIQLEQVVNSLGTVVGWGFDENGKINEQLTKAYMPIVSQETCIYSFPDFYSRFTSSLTFCAGFKNGTSVCNGDSGGGLVLPRAGSDKNNPVWQIRGLVSISVALQNRFKCDSSHYVVFTDVAKFSEFVNKALLQ